MHAACEVRDGREAGTRHGCGSRVEPAGKYLVERNRKVPTHT